MSFTYTVNVNHADDAENAWAQRDGVNLALWFNPNKGMTLADIVSVIESEFGQRGWRVDHVSIRGRTFRRAEFANHKAAEQLRDKESFNCQFKSSPCTIL